MASAAEERFYYRVQHFPAIINGRISITEFLAASTDLVAIVERLGNVFTPVKVDMQGNIDKILKLYKFDQNSCLLELMLNEITSGNAVVAEGILWLNRAFLFFELIFEDVLNNLKTHSNPGDVNMKKIFIKSYEGSVKKYHNWVTQQLFNFMCKMSPDLPKMLESLDIEDVAEYTRISETYNIQLHLVRCKIDDFFRDNNMFNESA